MACCRVYFCSSAGDRVSGGWAWWRAGTASHRVNDEMCEGSNVEKRRRAGLVSGWFLGEIPGLARD